MKTEEYWINELPVDGYGITQVYEADIRKIQADALRHAADIAKRKYANHFDHSQKKRAATEIAADLTEAATQLEKEG